MNVEIIVKDHSKKYTLSIEIRALFVYIYIDYLNKRNNE